MATAPHGTVKELRLATVLYGGVSLCIYMYGATKELHRLVEASHALEHGPAPAPGERTATVYRDLLADLAARDGIRTRVVVDVVAGTSAGGINGIFLAKALAHARSLEPLRQLWLDEGDVGKLLRSRALRWLWPPLGLALRARIGPGRPGSRGRLSAVAGKTLTALLGLLLALAAPVALPLLWLLDRARVLRPLLDGDRVFRLAFDALGRMDPDGPPSLMPDDHRLELFVTTTDIEGYDRRVRIWRPDVVADRRHRHVLAFAYERRSAGADDDSFDHGPPGASPTFPNAALALAARATSCFPGAFPPVSLASLPRLLGDRWSDADASLLERTHFDIYAASGAAPERSFFFDGGVLDNKPFGLAIRAIAERPASSEVDRKLLYLEPDPAGQTAVGAGEPRFLHTLEQALVKIPRSEPILDDLLEVRTLNESVGRLREVIDATRPGVARAVDRALAGRSPADPAVDLHAAAGQLLGPAYVGYVGLKLRSVLDQFATVTARLLGFPSDSNQAAFVHAVIHAWGEDRGLARPGARGAGGLALPPDAAVLTPEQVAFLRSFDLGYGRRRIRFVVQGINELYPGVDGRTEPPRRRDLDEAKGTLYGLRDRLSDVISGRALRGSPIERELRDLFGELRDPGWELERVRDHERGLTRNEARDPSRFASDRGDRLDAAEEALRKLLEQDAVLRGFNEALRRTVDELTSSWEEEPRRRVLVRFLGFPIWDAILFPARAFADLHELDEIEVVRLSPRDRSVLTEAAGGPGDLAGARLAHFGAFFSRAGREHDYLWGRLDGAEQLIAVVLGNPKPTDPPFREACKEAFAAILAEERERLTRVRPLVADLERRVAALRA